MTTIRLNINDKVLDKVLGLLNQFKNDDVEILVEDFAFEQHKKFLENELRKIDANEEPLLSFEEFKAGLEEVIAKHED